MNERIKYFFALTLLILFPITWGIQQPVFYFLGIAVFTFLGLVWLVLLSRSTVEFRVPKFLLIILIFIMLQVVLLLITPVKATGYNWLIFETYILFFFFFILDQTRNTGRRRFWENVLIGSGVIYAAIDLLYVLSWYARWWEINDGLFPLPSLIIRSPGILLGHPNTISSYLTLVIPFALVRFLSAKKSKRVIWIQILFILFIANFFTYSRGGWLSLAGALLVTLGLFFQKSWVLRRNLWSRIQHGRFGKFQYAGMGLLAITILGVFGLIARFLQSAPHGTSRARFDIYSYAVRWISTSPIWGHGTGSVPTLFALRDYAIGGDEMYHAHNFWLQITLESGLFGLLLIIIAIGFILWAFRSSWLKWGSNDNIRSSLAAYAGAGTAFIIHSMFERLLWSPAYVLAITIIIALVFSLASKREFIFWRKGIPIVILILVLLTNSAGLVFLKRSIPLYWEGKLAASTWNWQSARENICNAADLSPEIAFYSFQCSLANAYVADIYRDPEALVDALQYQKRALELDPNWYIHWANLSSYEWQQGEFTTAFSHMQKAVELAPNRTFLRVSLAWMAEQMENFDQALHYYQIAYCRDPRYQNSLLFQESQIFQLSSQEECPPEYDLLARNTYLNNIWAGEKALEAGDLTTAETHFLNAIPAGIESGDPYAFLALVHQQEGKITLSRKDLQTAMLIEDGSAIIHELAARIALSEGNQEQVYEHLSQAFLNIQNNSISTKYYKNTYLDAGLPSDLSPFIPSTVNNEQVALYEVLAAYLTERGDIQNSQRVKLWLEINKPKRLTKILSPQ